MKKSEVKIDSWQKEIAPSKPLRKWFAHNENKWDGFKQCYFQELDKKGGIIDLLLSKAKRNSVTLLYSAKNEKFNNAVALKEYLDLKLKKM